MILLDRISVANAIPPGVIKNNAAYVSNVIDTADPKYAGAKTLTFLVLLGTIDAALAVLKVMQAEAITDAQTLTSGVLLGDTAVKPQSTDGGHIHVINVDLKQPHSRYLQLQATAGSGSAGAYLSGAAIFDLPMSAGGEPGTVTPGATYLDMV